MRKIKLLFSLALTLTMLHGNLLVAQVDPSVSIIDIAAGAGNEGLLEATINGDVDGDGKRLNPNRIYRLEAGGIYIQNSAINFNDSTATLNIIGAEEDGKNMPMVLMQPIEGQGTFTNNVNGNLNLENVYWPAMNLDGDGGVLFQMAGTGLRLELDNFVTENARSDVFALRGINGNANVYIKNSYFRDMSQLSNSWNYVVFARGDNGEPFDTLWVENTTVSNAGMPFFGKLNPTNFFYFNHNTIVNSTKYPIWMERFAEAYVTNNLFINANYEGECQSTWETQIGEDFIPTALVRFDTVESGFWTSSPDDAPAQEDVKILASNNLSFFSPFLDKYYNGDWNDEGDFPISNRPWGPGVDEADLPIPVSHVRPGILEDREMALVAEWDGIKEDNNMDNVDPMMVTKGIADQAAGDEFAKFARTNYGVAELGEEFDRQQIWFGDGNAATIPGAESEEGGGFEDVTGLPEDFSYTSDIRSKIDGMPLGALHWWPSMMDSWDSEAGLADVMQYYVDTVSVSVLKVEDVSRISVYPNPVHELLNISSEDKLANAIIYDITGKMRSEIQLYGVFTKSIDVSSLEKGFYIMEIHTISGQKYAHRLLKK